MINPLTVYRRWVSNYVNRLYLLSGYGFNRDFVAVIATYTPIIIVALMVAYALTLVSTVRNALLMVIIVLLIDYLSVLMYANARVYVRSSHFERYLVNT
ncbi:hypothetical protein [Vulcanisaeta sp. JCM 16161]|uniref:hypothetical protein n=1 Tax=Vulcanisaeta sp. JCM 16161 TaxID=1295372 RepID=UPI000B05BF58|nr:hypothetical protein [Vulcanisaeta sp. JCM 16161]